MVCDRCKTVVSALVKKHGATVKHLQLGKLIAQLPADFNTDSFQESLQENGFELMQNSEQQWLEKIKVTLITLVNEIDEHKDENLSETLAKKLHKSYTSLSKLFKTYEGITIEKYVIQLKIERVKELIQMNQLSFSEIAYQLNYKSISHLSGQFKQVTGITMSAYKNQQNWSRNPLDKIM